MGALCLAAVGSVPLAEAEAPEASRIMSWRMVAPTLGAAVAFEHIHQASESYHLALCAAAVSAVTLSVALALVAQPTNLKAVAVSAAASRANCAVSTDWNVALEASCAAAACATAAVAAPCSIEIPTARYDLWPPATPLPVERPTQPPKQTTVPHRATARAPAVPSAALAPLALAALVALALPQEFAPSQDALAEVPVVLPRANAALGRGTPVRVPVLLHVYDVSKEGAIKQLNGILSFVSVQLGGVFHAGVEVLGREWSFGYNTAGTGVSSGHPRSNPNHSYRRSIAMRGTLQSAGEVAALIHGMASENCCHFADDLCQRLGAGNLPAWIHRFARIGDSVMNVSRDLQLRLGSVSCRDAAARLSSTAFMEEHKEPALVSVPAPPSLMRFASLRM